MTKARYRCRACGKITAGRIPPNGDGTFYYPRRHKGTDGKPCRGNCDEADEIEPDCDALELRGIEPRMND